ncbi:IclR family transcriptional regulator [Nocardioides lentus]|uniref:IclR family transcriptional regulator n=1 Tax=Nocardioides lentus TaxID=338077 RepID=A0ABP5B314_9ACTN
MEEEVDPKNIVGSIVKGAQLLELFRTDRRELSLSEFTAESGFNKTTTFRLLRTLVSVGWLVRSESGGYRLGPRVMALGGIARSDLDLRSEALPFLRHLAAELGDTAFLMVPGQLGAVTIETVVGANPLQVHGLSAGSVMPYHVAAGPVVLAAYSPELESLVLGMERRSYTDRTISETEPLRARFAEVREQGYCLSSEDYIVGVGAVAAPVSGADGRLVASLSVGGPVDRFRGEQRDRAIELVIEAARQFSRQLA